MYNYKIWMLPISELINYFKGIYNDQRIIDLDQTYLMIDKQIEIWSKMLCMNIENAADVTNLDVSEFNFIWDPLLISLLFHTDFNPDLH